MRPQKGGGQTRAWTLLPSVILLHVACFPGIHAGSRTLLQASAPALLASIGRSPGQSPSDTRAPAAGFPGPAIVFTLDLYGASLLNFSTTQQETLLMVLNDTIADANYDELELINIQVDENVPLSGSSISNGRNSSTNQSAGGAPSPGARRMLLGARRALLQGPGPPGPPPLESLASNGSLAGLSSLPHLKAVVRISTARDQVELVKQEIIDTVNGPMLGMLNQRGIGVQRVSLRSLGKENSDGSVSSLVPGSTAESGQSSELPHYAIGLIVAAGVVFAAGLFAVGFFWRRKRRAAQESVRESKDGASSHPTPTSIKADGSQSSPATSNPSDASPALLRSGLLSLLGTPPSSLVSSRNSTASKPSVGGEGERAAYPMGDTGMWNVPLGELQFSRVIGEGSFGKVYLGKWQETTVALKILTSPGGPLPDDSWDLQDVTQLRDCSWVPPQQEQSAAQRLLVVELNKESSLMASLRHPNIVLFLGVCLDPPCMVTEFCARGSLLDVLGRARTNKAVAAELDWRRRLKLALDAAKGMHYLHTRQPPVLHRDLKSANLLVDKHWQAKVADFNLSRVMQPSAAVSSLAASNPRWLPPEVLAGNGYDSTADVYAFGIILWELLSWEVPWKDETPWQVVISVVDHDRRPELPAEEDLPGGWPADKEGYLSLMQQCWTRTAQSRPSYENIIGQMRTIIDAEDALARRKYLEASASAN